MLNGVLSLVLENIGLCLVWLGMVNLDQFWLDLNLGNLWYFWLDFVCLRKIWRFFVSFGDFTLRVLSSMTTISCYAKDQIDLLEWRIQNQMHSLQSSAIFIIFKQSFEKAPIAIALYSRLYIRCSHGNSSQILLEWTRIATLAMTSLMSLLWLA